MSFLGSIGSALGASSQSVGGSLITSALNNAFSISAMQRNQRYAREQMAFEERLANSAHQREVADLRASGVNPILTATGGNGAYTPAGQSGSIAQATAEGFDSASAKELFKYFDSQKEQTETQTDNVKTDTTLKGEEIKNAPVVRERAKAEGRKLDADATAQEIENQWNKDHPTLYSIKQTLPIVGTALSAIGQGVGGVFKGMTAFNSAKSVANDTARTMILANKYADSKSKSTKK